MSLARDLISKVEETNQKLDHFLVQSLSKQISNDLGITFDLHFERESPDFFSIFLCDLEVPLQKRGQGLARLALERLCEFADEHQSVIQLMVANDKTGNRYSLKPDLVKFYKKFGFIENWGGQEYDSDADMVRFPEI